MTSIKEDIRKRMIKQLKCDYTIGREDKGLTSYSDEQLQTVYSNEAIGIDMAVEEMYEDFKNNGELEDLQTGTEKDAYREYLYSYVNIVIPEFKEEVKKIISQELEKVFPGAPGLITHHIVIRLIEDTVSSIDHVNDLKEINLKNIQSELLKLLQ